MNSNSPYDEGDIVELRSGGPKMTISSKRNNSNEYSYTCMWFSPKAKLKSGTFSEDCLKLIKSLNKEGNKE